MRYSGRSNCYWEPRLSQSRIDRPCERSSRGWPCAMVPGAMTALPDIATAVAVSLRVPRTLWVLASPQQTFTELAEDDAKPARGYFLMFLWLLIELVLGAPTVAASILADFKHKPVHGLTHLYAAYLRYAIAPAVGMFVVGLCVYYVLRLRKRRRDLWTCVSVVGYAWVPHLVLVALGALLATFGIDHPFPAPHLYARPELGTARTLIAALVEIGPTATWVFIATRALLAGDIAQPISSGERSRTWVVTLLFSALMVTSATGATRTVRAQRDLLQPLALGDAVPALTLLDIDGKPTPGPVFIDKVSIIDFWATWCGPCRATLPMLDRAGQIPGVQLVSINTEANDLGVVREFVKETGLSAKVYVDSGAAQERFQVTGLPTTVIVDKNGKIARAHLGPVSEDELKRELEQLLR